ncbi:MAG: nucleotidyltransferase domain-containing protein [Chlamydiia bacterium]|nr:nucleotidyltransferase domain-containing protein [Chlamydiia bacterium]
MRRPKIDIPKKDIEEFCKKNHIDALALFGSVLSDQFNSESDIDFLVQFERDHKPSLFGIVRMEEELKVLFQRDIDLKTPFEISKFFREEVIKEAYPIYGSKRFQSHRSYS